MHKVLNCSKLFQQILTGTYFGKNLKMEYRKHKRLTRVGQNQTRA